MGTKEAPSWKLAKQRQKPHCSTTHLLPTCWFGKQGEPAISILLRSFFSSLTHGSGVCVCSAPWQRAPVSVDMLVTKIRINKNRHDFSPSSRASILLVIFPSRLPAYRHWDPESDVQIAFLSQFHCYCRSRFPLINSLVYTHTYMHTHTNTHMQLANGSASLPAIPAMPAMWETRVQSLGWEDPLEKEMATHSSILAWRIPWTEELDGLLSLGLQRVGHYWGNSHTLILWVNSDTKWYWLEKYSQPKSWELCFITWEFLGLQNGITNNPQRTALRRPGRSHVI